MTNLDLAQYLSGKGVRTFRAAGDEITSNCWWCDDGNPKGKGKLYLNSESWLYSCKRCGASGNRKTLLRHYGDQDDVSLTYLPGQDPMLRRKVLREAVALGEEMLYNNAEVLEYLKNRGLSMQTIVEARLGYAAGSWSLAGSLREGNMTADLISAGILNPQGQESFSKHILIPYLSHGDIVQVRGKAIGGVTLTASGDHARVYGADYLHGARDAVVVEGEMDCLILRQVLAGCPDAVLRQTAVVAMPGAQSLPQNIASYFEQCRKVYVAFDADEAGRTGAAKLKALIGTKARLVELPAELPACDWNDYLLPKSEGKPHSGHGWRDVANLLADADAVGRRLFTVRDAQMQWSRIETEVGGIRTGWSHLDAYTAPGLKPGQLMVPISRTGVGKTQVLVNLAWNTRERPTLVLSLEMTASEFYERLRRVALFWDPFATDEQINEQFHNLRIVDQRLRLGDIGRFVDEFYDDVGVGPQQVFLDYLGYYSQSLPGKDQYERTTKAVIEAKESAKAGGFVMVAPHQANRTAAKGVPVTAEDARDSGAIEDTADVLFGLWRPSDADRSGGVTSTVQGSLLKNRNGRKDVVMSFNFSLASLVLVQAGTAEARTVEDENALIMRGNSYADVLKMRRQNMPAVQLRLA